MPQFDYLLGKSIVHMMKKHIGQNTLEKIENRVFEKFGTNLIQVSTDFSKLNLILREFYGEGSKTMLSQLLKNVITVRQSTTGNKEWVTIEDAHIHKIILEAIGDEDKKKIFSAVLDRPRIISEILEICKIPQTSGYRKINHLIQNGLLIINGYELTYDGRMINRYQPIFDNIQIHVEKNKVTLQVQLSETYLEQSNNFIMNFQNLIMNSKL